MKEVKIIEIPLIGANSLDQICVELRNERYFLAHEANPQKRVSVQFSDLSWIRKHFGFDKNVQSIITNDSLNIGRRNEIKSYEFALEHNIPLWQFGSIDPETNKARINPETGEQVSLHDLSEQARIEFQSKINEGLVVLCKYV